MAFDKDPHDPTGTAGGSGDPADDARAKRAARLARLTRIDQELGAAMDEIAEGEVLIRRTLARRCEIAERTLRLYEERNNIISANTTGWTPEITAKRETAMEIGVTLRIPEPTASDLVNRAETLVHELPATRAALTAGKISFRHMEAITTESWSMPPEGRPAFDAAVVPAAVDTTVSQFKKRMKVIRERLHPISLATRHEIAVKERSVWVDNGPDGMATLTYIDSAEKIIPIFNRIDKTARALQGTNEERTLPQLRADALGDLGLNGTPSKEYDKGVVPTVLIAVPALTAMNEGQEPGMMEGYGPIDPDTARRLSARAPSFFRILTEPESGAILNVGRTAYKVPADLKRFVHLRDGTCRGGSGCPAPADQCDIDHTIDWQYGGETSAGNLACLCKSHHNFKARSSWTVKQIGGGRLDWTSPSGRTHITEPNSFIGPMPFEMPAILSANEEPTPPRQSAPSDPSAVPASAGEEPGQDPTPEIIDRHRSRENDTSTGFHPDRRDPANDGDPPRHPPDPPGRPDTPDPPDPPDPPDWPDWPDWPDRR
ncbi:HNH endonuclease signature motif containing protein [Glaciihabitans sp. dw_435]|uniref:HNH endonuclease n=1 Tax=Glaciihabitans sp. dw_435 TaxID=2720081 RepID=UPI001BD432B0|nr:HNH endonuclease signature motif containing protein [Glaciihabitans sp. dw_435]